MGSTLDVKTDTGVALISHYYAGEVLSSPHYEHSMSLWNEGADDAVRHDDENSSPKITFGFRHHHFARAVRNAITITTLSLRSMELNSFSKYHCQRWKNNEFIHLIPSRVV